MTSLWKYVNHTIFNADVLLMVLDVRYIEDTRNREIERKVAIEGKPLIYVLTKCDLMEEDEIRSLKTKLSPVAFVSGKEGTGLVPLRDKILSIAHNKGIKKRPLSVGILGYPNVGKSSLINSWVGKDAAGVGAKSGYTRSVQKVQADGKIVLLDTPGVIPMQGKDFLRSAQTGTLDAAHTRRADDVIFEIMKKFPGKVERYYGVAAIDDYEETIEIIAEKNDIMKRGKKKGTQPDFDRMCKMILADWQRGLIK